MTFGGDDVTDVRFHSGEDGRWCYLAILHATFIVTMDYSLYAGVTIGAAKKFRI